MIDPLTKQASVEILMALYQKHIALARVALNAPQNYMLALDNVRVAEAIVVALEGMGHDGG